MKLILVLSIIAYGYADKLDRAYLPPPNAASSGGSPGSLTVPEVQSKAFGQGLPGSGRQPGLNGFRKPITSQNGLSEDAQNSYGTPNFGSTFHPRGDENSAIPSGNGYSASTRISESSGSTHVAPSSIQQFSSNGFSDSNQNFPSAGIPKSGSYNQGFGQEEQGLNGIAPVYNQERPQADAERNAKTLKFINKNNGESYSYSYETSNGISAEESGVAINGVMAQGGYAYTGDDGKAYSVTYTADENGYQPQGEHLPTPHPIPEEILKSIEENAKAAAAGTQEGAYRPEEYESEVSQSYNIGSGTSYQSKQGQEQGQGPASNPTKNNQYQGINQIIGEQNLQIDRSSQNGPVNQQYNKDTFSGQGFNRPNQGEFQQKNQGFLQESSQSYRPSQSQTQSVVNGQLNNLPSNRGSTTQDVGQFAQSQGYHYNQPQNTFQPKNDIQGSVNQYRPQASSQRQNAFASVPSGSVFRGNQDNIKTSFGNRPSTDLFGPQQSQSKIGSSQQAASAIRPLPVNGPNRPQNQITSFSKQSQENQNNQPFNFQQGINNQGYQYQPKQPSPGFKKPNIINNSGSHNEGIINKPSFNSNNNQKQGPQSSFYESTNIPSQNSQIFKMVNIQNGAPVNNQAGQNPQFSQNANKPSITYNQAPHQISQYQQSAKQPNFGNRQPGQGSQFPSLGQGIGNNNNFGPGPSVSSGAAQAPYQYSKPSQSFTTQPPRFLPLESQSSKGKPGQQNQDKSEEFGGPRLPPSFSSQEGYKY